MSVIELLGVSKIFPNRVEAVAGVDLTVGIGEFVALVGPSGSGKSTLLRLIAGLDEPTSGVIRIDDEDVTGAPPRDRDVAMVFQEPALFPYLNVFENLAFSLRARPVGEEEVRARVLEVAASLELSGVLERRPATLSGGQKRRVALGRAIARRPAAFLLDEPLTGLDTPLRSAIRADLTRILRITGAAVLYVTHDQAEALSIGDRVAVMDQGRIVQVGSPRDVYERPSAAFVGRFIGSPPMNLISCRASGEVDAVGLLEVVGVPRSSFPVAEETFQTLMKKGVGNEMDLGIRPEHVLIGVPDDGSGGAVGWVRLVTRVTRVDYLGHESVATLALGTQKVLARVGNTSSLRPGAEVTIGFDLSRASWFHRETGAAVAPRLPATALGDTLFESPRSGV